MTCDQVRKRPALNPEINTADLVESKVIRYKSFDGMVIPSILYKPQQASATKKAPALLWIHGGPGGQTRTGYSGVIQYLVNHGYVVLGVNNRGSSGRKNAFTADIVHGREPPFGIAASASCVPSRHQDRNTGGEEAAMVPRSFADDRGLRRPARRLHRGPYLRIDHTVLGRSKAPCGRDGLTSF
jgi:hypothetical protein